MQFKQDKWNISRLSADKKGGSKRLIQNKFQAIRLNYANNTRGLTQSIK